jgi:phosphoenolpyruvate-protein phosphotransferase (PTS system enzyme I)
MAGRRTFFFDGQGVSDGIAIGPASVIEGEGEPGESYPIADDQVEREITRFREALRLAGDEIASIGRQVAEKIDRQQAAIFEAHLMMLEDPNIVDRTIKHIRREKRNAESVFWEVTSELGEQMKALGDAYFTERNHDLFDVTRRVIKFLRELNAASRPAIPHEGCIVVANSIGPAETAALAREKVLGFCTNAGGPTSHMAIMAKALSLPAVTGLEYVTHYVRSGDMLILDGTEGKLILHPTLDQVEYYRKRVAELRSQREALAELRSLPAVTTDGERITLQANLEFPIEMDAVEENGAEGIGLFRTEFLYMDERHIHDWDHHVEQYRLVLSRMKDKQVVMRTLDIGGDKLPSGEFPIVEANPFLGLRAVRLCLHRRDLFRAQLKAMLTAAGGRDLDVMIPMVSSLEEVRESRIVLEECRAELKSDHVPLPTAIRLGIMIEIPSAALMAREFADEVDFLSIGTNDLIQYTLAVDRVNRAVASLYRPTHPAVLRLIRLVAQAGREAGKPVSVCGEMASVPRYAILLVGLGIRHLSMGPASIGRVKSVIRGISLAVIEELAGDVLQCRTADEADSLLRTRLVTMMKALEPASSGTGRANKAKKESAKHDRTHSDHARAGDVSR